MVGVTNSWLTVRGRLTFPATLARVTAGRTTGFLKCRTRHLQWPCGCTHLFPPIYMAILTPLRFEFAISPLLNGCQVSGLRALEVWSWDCPCTVYNIVVICSSCTSLPANTSSHSIPLESLPSLVIGLSATESVYSKVDTGGIPLASPENYS